VDSDALWAPGMMERLWYWDKPILAPLAFSRNTTMPFTWTEEPARVEDGVALHGVLIGATRRWLEANPGLVKAEPVILGTDPEIGLAPSGFLSTHILLAHREVYEAVGREHPGRWFERLTDAAEYATASDVDFSAKAMAAGYRLWVDYTQWAGHQVGNHIIGPVDFLALDRVIDWQTRKVVLDKQRSEED
jgi:hypothetical protein